MLMIQAPSIEYDNKQEEDATFAKYKAGDKEAGNKLYNDVRKWALRCVQQRSYGFLDRMEEDSLVNLTVAQALSVHQPERGKLAGTVKWVARSLVRIHLSRNVGAVYVPCTAWQSKSEEIREKARRGSKRFSWRKGTNPIAHVPEDHSAENKERAKQQAIYKDAMNSLKKDRWKDILHRRHLGETLDSIAISYGISRQRVQQITLLAAFKFSVYLTDYWTNDWQPMSPLVNEKMLRQYVLDDRFPTNREICNTCKLKDKCKAVLVSS